MGSSQKTVLLLNTLFNHIKQIKFPLLVCLLIFTQGIFAQSDDAVSGFLDDFMSQIENGGITIDEEYLQGQTNMPEDMKAALRDSLQGREAFVLNKDKASSFLGNFSRTLNKYGFESEGNSIKLKDNRLLNLNVTGPDLKALFGGGDANDTPLDTTSASFRVHDINDDLYNPSTASNLDLQNPKNSVQDVVYDPLSGKYIFSNKVGDEELNVPVAMNTEEYNNYSLDESINNYWESKSFGEEEEGDGSLLNLGLDFSSSSKMFGAGAVDIKPQGYADLTFSIKTTKTDNPTVTEDRRKNTYFDLDNKIQMNVLGSVGDKINLDMNYNTEATFDFDNQFKLEFNGKEDDILKHFSAGNVSMPSVGSMITVGGNSSSGGQSSVALPGYQKLWGFQSTQQYGKLTWSWVVSQQESETETMTLEGGATTQEFEVPVDEYDANRHFFLTHFFKENYDSWMAYMPNEDISGLNISKIEVWVTNKSGVFDQARNVVAFMDLGEPEAEDLNNSTLWPVSGLGQPDNTANDLYSKMTTTYGDIRDINEVSTVLGPLESQGFMNGEDYEKVSNARLLSSSEYTVNTTLGYISLNSALNTDEVLAVAFQYTYKGEVHTVGEFSSGSGVTAPDALYLKMLKATNQSPSLPTWDLMMKNVYALAYNISEEDFTFSIVYNDDKVGTELPYISVGDISEEILLRVMGLDQLNSSNEAGPDGFFDWVEGYTVNQQTGRIIFPVREPFGSHLKKEIGNDLLAENYIFQELYDTTLVAAQQMAEKNKFTLVGKYKSSSGSEIKLNGFNIPRGSVKVTAGGRQLVENVDYTVDYNSGYLRILNEGVLESGQTVQVSMENQSLFSLQKKTLLGSNFVYRFSDDLQIGASVTHLNERPTTTKVAVGSDPISNTVWGLTGAWNTDLPFLTKAIDKLPFTDTKAPSSMTVRAEVAQLIAGHNDAIGESGSVYVDDFESTTIGINVMSYYAWDISSVPKRFDESDLNDNLEYGYNRAKLAWYSIDRMMQDETSETPTHIKKDADERSNHYVRSVEADELFPNSEQDYGESTYVPILNLAYYPEEKGPYNYDTDLDGRGRLNDPEKRWGGITRKLETTNFENTNIEYIEFWMMDPFIYDQSAEMGGEVVINLGNISEDVLKDGRKSFENGLPTSSEVTDVDTTAWGRVSSKQSLVNAFDNDEDARQYQDIGMDGLNNTDESYFFQTYVSALENLKSSISSEYHSYLDSLINDPSQDDYQYFRSSDFDALEAGVLKRYKNYNNHEGNSPSSLNSDESYSTAGTSTPDDEDINQDFTLSESDSYYEYSFRVSPSDTVVGENFIVDTRIESATLANGSTEDVKWYQYRIPIHEYEDVVGSISDFTSIRFMRMYMTDFQKPIIMRLANMELVRSEWRRYGLEIEPDVYDELNGDIDVEAVNYEENSDRQPVNYILPPEVTRQTDPSQPTITQLNEQSMVMRVRNLSARDSRATYKVMQMDFRQYENLQMWVHAEALPNTSVDYTTIEDDDLALFIRIGSDYNDNYYEYELPLSLTASGVYDGDDESDRYIVWPEDNRLDFPLELFTELKQLRNANDIDYTEHFTQVVASNTEQKVSMKGNPSLSNVKMIMLGVRNTKQQATDSRSAEIWVNELRLTGLDEDGGWTGSGSMSVKLADIGSANASGTFSTAGWGSIEQTLMDRQMTDNKSFDVSTSLELGKLLPRKAKIQMPMYYAYSKSVSTPKYDPLDQDLLLQDELDAADSQSEVESILEDAQTFETRKSINFSNVKFNISGKKKRFYDPVNLSASYAYTEMNAQSETVESETSRDRRFGLNYSFSPSSKPVEPFKNIDAFKSDYLALIRDFNFYLKPQKIAFSSDLDRSYYEQQNRDLSDYDLDVPLLVSKSLSWDNAFSFNYKLARSLSVDFSASSYAIVDETVFDDDDGNLISINELHNKIYATEYENWKDTLMRNLMDFGRLMDYSQNFNVRYNVPLNKIPMFDFISVDAAYSATYGWERGSDPFTYYTNEAETESITVNNGNEISNTQRGTLNSSLKMTTLYNKSKYLSDISRKYGRIGGTSRPEYKTETFELKDINVKKGEVLTIKHKMGSTRANMKVFDANGKLIHGNRDTKDENTILFVPNEDIVDGRATVSARVEDKDSFDEKVIGYTLNALMGLRTVSLNMTRNGSTVLPGFMPDNNLFSSGVTPGWDFALGQQSRHLLTGDFKKNDELYFIREYERKEWLASDETFSEPYMITSGEQITARATIEPLAGLSVQLSSNYTHQERLSAYYLDSNGDFDPTTNLSRSGSYLHTYMALGTLFNDESDEYYGSKAYDNFVKYRSTIATRQTQRLTSRASNPADYENVTADPNSSEVLIPAFLAAYSGKDIEDLGDVSLSTSPTWRSMIPNWSVTYQGLAKTNLLKDHVKSLTLSHNYTSTYNVSNFITLTDYDASSPSVVDNNDGNTYFQTEYDISSVTITEGLNPLIGVDVTLRNNLSFDFSMSKLRALALNISSNQLIETRNDEIVIGAGYRFEDLKLFVKTSNDKKKRAINNDLRINADFSISDVVSIIRRIEEENVQPSSGNKVTAVKLTANYNVNSNLEVTLFYDKQITSPVVSTSYRTSNSTFGLTFRFSLTD